MYLAKDLADWAYWMGRGAELLEVANQPVTIQEFERLQHGEHPGTGEPIRARRSSDRLDGKGMIINRGRGVFDMVVSPPKSLSVVATLYDDRLIDAHKETVQRLMRSMEQLAMTRVRRNGAEENRETKNIIAAPWLHLHSRAPDAHLHTHLTVLNLTYDPVEESWKALQAVGIYRAQHELSEQYRESLSKRVRELGYDIRATGRTTHSFELNGVPETVIAEHSRRSEQRDEKIREWQADHGEGITPRNILALVRQERPKKNLRMTIEAIRAAHLAQLSPSEHDRLEHLVGQAMERAEKLGYRPTWVDPHLRTASPVESEDKKPQLKLHDQPHYEPAQKREMWDYGSSHRSPRVGF